MTETAPTPAGLTVDPTTSTYWLAVTLAVQTKGAITTSADADLLAALDEAAALGRATLEAREKYPESDGWEVRVNVKRVGIEVRR